MILTRQAIEQEIKIDPRPDQFQMNPHSLDLRLDDGYVLNGGERRILTTFEKLTLPATVMGVVYPRSSTNRRGITVDMTGVVDANYSGKLMLPVTNTTDKPITLMRGERIASIIFHRLEEPAIVRLSKYHDGTGSYLPDKSVETELLANGDLEALKLRYSL